MVLLAASLVSLGGTGTARAYDIVDQTYFLNIRQGTPLSDTVARLSIGSLALSTGGSIDANDAGREPDRGQASSSATALSAVSATKGNRP